MHMLVLENETQFNWPILVTSEAHIRPFFRETPSMAKVGSTMSQWPAVVDRRKITVSSRN